MASYPKKPRTTKRRGRHPDRALSAVFCRNVAEAGRYCDGNGLYLEVDPTGARRWVQRLVIRGKPRTLGLGGFGLVTLAEAREVALANRRLARSGGDPLAARRRTGHADLRGGRGRRPRTEAGRLAERQAREGLAHEPAALRVPADRRQAGFRDHLGRPAAGARAHLAREAGDGTPCSSADRRRHEVGRCHGTPRRQPGRRGARRGARPPAGRRAAHAGASAPRGRRSGRGGAGLPGVGRNEARVRVPRADGGPFRGGTSRDLGRDRRHDRRLDRPWLPHEGQAPAPRAAVRAGAGARRGGAGASWRRGHPRERTRIPRAGDGSPSRT